MPKPKIKPPEPWQPGMLVNDFMYIKPAYATEHAIVNITRQTIMRALVSSRTEIKGKR